VTSRYYCVEIHAVHALVPIYFFAFYCRMAFTPIESSNQYVLMISENLSIVKFGESITKVKIPWSLIRHVAHC